MSKRRAWIILLFVVIGAVAISKTLLLRQSVNDGRQEEWSSRQSGGERLSIPGREGQSWSRLLDRLLVLTVTLPFIITALLLFVYSLQVE